MRISDWSSDVCSSDLNVAGLEGDQHRAHALVAAVAAARPAAQLAQRQVDVVLNQGAVLGPESQRVGESLEALAGVVDVGLWLHQQEGLGIQDGMPNDDVVMGALTEAKPGPEAVQPVVAGVVGLVLG